MERNRIKHYLAYGAGIIAFCWLFALNDYRASQAAKARGDARMLTAGDPNTDDNAPSKPGKSSQRPAAPKPATDQELEKFSRFFLPPIKLEEATIDQAVAGILAAYRETAEATGEPALDVRVDMADARTRKPITCTTPRAPAGTVLRYAAAIAGNRTKGSLPSFRLEALSDEPDRDGKLEVPPTWESELADFFATGKKGSEGKLGEHPFEHLSGDDDAAKDPLTAGPAPKVSLKELLISLGFNPAVQCQSSASPGLMQENLTYENMSEAEVEWLSALVETATCGGLGSVQVKTDTKVLVVPDSLADRLNSGAAFHDGEVQLMMRKFASTQGVDLMTLPYITSRQGQTGTVELVNPGLTPEGAETWTGVRMATTAVPYGLGSQTEFALETRGLNGTYAETREQITLPEHAKGIAIAPYEEGSRLIVIQGSAMIDAMGQPIAAPR